MKIVKFGNRFRRIEHNGLVHFSGGTHQRTLCGEVAAETDLFGNTVKPPVQTSQPVNCPACARLYCAVKNAPWNEVDGKVLERATYAAVKV